MLKALAVSIGLLCAPGLVAAEPYRLGIGDEIVISHNGLDEPLVSAIDVDGDVRIPDIGRVTLNGLTLGSAESLVSELLEDGGLFVGPAAQIEVQSYAPIVVGGDVGAPGRFAYAPGLTVAAAVALAGGLQGPGLSETEIARAQSDALAGQQTANLDIALAFAQLLRFEAVDSNEEIPLTATHQLANFIPDPEAAGLAELIAREVEVLRSERLRAQRLLAFWEEEIATIEVQRDNFDQRIAVQLEIVASAMRNLESAQELSDRGLQTAGRLASAEQRAAEARSRVLELEAAKIAAARALSTAKRERVLFIANQEREALLGIQDAHRTIAAAQYRHARFTAQYATLSKGRMGSEDVRYIYDLQTTRAGRPESGALSPQTPVLPGEVLIVTAVPLVDDVDG